MTPKARLITKMTKVTKIIFVDNADFQSSLVVRGVSRRSLWRFLYGVLASSVRQGSRDSRCQSVASASALMLRSLPRPPSYSSAVREAVVVVRSWVRMTPDHPHSLIRNDNNGLFILKEYLMNYGSYSCIRIPWRSILSASVVTRRLIDNTRSPAKVKPARE
jgi:hypothetical protein